MNGKYSEQRIGEHLHAQYGLRVFSMAPMVSGVVNDNFRVESDAGVMLMKVYTMKSSEEVRFEADALARLAKDGFPSPRLLASVSGDTITAFDGRPSVLYPFIEGAPQKMWSLVALAEVGGLMGRMHRVLSGYENRAREGLWDHDRLPELVASNGAEIVRAGYPEGEALLARVSAELAAIALPNDLPRGFTHQDIKPENVIMSEGGVAGIVDFDNAYHGVLLHDITTAVIWSCYDHGSLVRSRVNALLEGYEAERPLADEEKECFADALKFRLVREAFIGPYAAHPSAIGRTKERSDYFLSLV